MHDAPIGEPKYPNPLFEKHTTRGFISTWWRFITFFFGISTFLFIIITLIIARNPKNYITLAVISGNTRHTDTELVSVINETLRGNYVLMYPKKNIYVAKTSAISDALRTRFFYETVTVQKVYTKHSLFIEVTEKPLEYVLRYNDLRRYIAQDGTILDSVSDTLDDASILEISVTPEHIQINEDTGREFIDQSLIVKTTELEQEYDKIFTSTFPRAEFPTVAGTDVKLHTNGGWYIHLDVSKNTRDQLQNAFNVYNEKIKGTSQEATLHYIDVRVETRAYYL